MWTLGGGLSYHYPAMFSRKLSGINVALDYEHKESRTISNVYRLTEEVSAWEDTDMFSTSLSGLYEGWDAALSYSSLSRADQVNISGAATLELHDEKYDHYFKMVLNSVKFSLTPRHYLYVSRGEGRRLDRTEKMFNLSGNIIFSMPFLPSAVYEIKYSSTPLEAPLSQMVDIPSSNPTTLFLGNPGLKNAQRHAASLRITRGDMKNIRRVYLF